MERFPSRVILKFKHAQIMPRLIPPGNGYHVWLSHTPCFHGWLKLYTTPIVTESCAFWGITVDPESDRISWATKQQALLVSGMELHSSVSFGRGQTERNDLLEQILSFNLQSSSVTVENVTTISSGTSSILHLTLIPAGENLNPIRHNGQVNNQRDNAVDTFVPSSQSLSLVFALMVCMCRKTQSTAFIQVSTDLTILIRVNVFHYLRLQIQNKQ